METERFRRLIDAAAATVGLPLWIKEGETYAPGEWLEGQILVESGGNPRAVRYEAHQDRGGDPDTATVDDGFLEDDRSYGLMQVMGYNVRKLCGVPAGVAMNFEWVLLPISNLALGLRMLSAELNTTRLHVPSALARYNGGPFGNLPGAENLRNILYVEKVAAAAHSVKVHRARE